jgi:hypothetical protein
LYEWTLELYHHTSQALYKSTERWWCWTSLLLQRSVELREHLQTVKTGTFRRYIGVIVYMSDRVGDGATEAPDGLKAGGSVHRDEGDV